jgi:hypothetical protein
LCCCQGITKYLQRVFEKDSIRRVPLSSSSLQFGPLLEPFPKEDMGEMNGFDANMKSTLQRNEDTDEAAHEVEGDETKASKVHGNIDLTDSVKSTAKSQNQQQKSKRKKRNMKATPLGIQVREKYATMS